MIGSCLKIRAKYLVWLALGVAVCLIAFAPLPGAASAPVDRVFSVEASQYSYTPVELHANPGDHVSIELVSTDVVHGLYIDGYNISVVADPGQTARLEFVADREGSFHIRCNVTCGAMHPFMIGRFRVGPNMLLLRAIGLAGLAVFGALAVFFIQQSPPLIKLGDKE